MIEYTFSMIKPTPIKEGNYGKIITIIQDANLKIIAQKMMQIDLDLAKELYQEHKERSFFNTMLNYITSGPVVVQILRGKGAIKLNRDIMGHTNPKDAAPHTIRKIFGKSIDDNAIHGSDSSESAQREMKLFFDDNEIYRNI